MIQEEMQSFYAILNAGLDKISYAIKATSPEVAAIHSGRAYDITYNPTIASAGASIYLVIKTNNRDIHMPSRSISTSQPNVTLTRYKVGSEAIGALTTTGIIKINANKYFSNVTDFEIGTIPSFTVVDATIDDFDKIFGTTGNPVNRAGVRRHRARLFSRLGKHMCLK